MSWPSQNIWTLPSKYFLKIIVAFHNWRQKNTGRVNRKYGLLKINLLYKVSCHSFYGFVHLSYLVPFFYFSQKTSASLALINCRFLWDIGLTFKSKLRKYAFLNNFLSYTLCIWKTWLINTCLFFFLGCAGLKHVTISMNRALETIDASAFDSSMTSLHSLDLSDNSLKNVPSSLVPWLRLKSLDLSGNPWRCDCDLSFLPKILHTLSQKSNNNTDKKGKIYFQIGKRLNNFKGYFLPYHFSKKMKGKLTQN